eukprot:TRINITY_DN16117_c0_g2_i3.p1 TRINITY_DN16117_c0_g2~~TRINITY_DN16117_c0_g2_i3.p1  ORF type:complete len:156 (-),score=24.50 TRINITY_DN16117_c0_g2_i3:232-699(-)
MSKSPQDFAKTKQLIVNFCPEKGDICDSKEAVRYIPRIEEVKASNINKNEIVPKNEELKLTSAFSVVRRINLAKQVTETSMLLFQTFRRLNSLNGQILSQWLLLNHQRYEKQQEELLGRFSGHAIKLASISSSLLYYVTPSYTPKAQESVCLPGP